MAERARLAKIPQPETALKCPRCESTNTKFCYFNNYSLSQPRHFCKTCRRYWTRGGALRSVPVGGGCRRNKRRSKGSRSNSPVTTTSDTQSSNSTSTSHLLPPPHLSIFPPLQNLADLSNADIGMSYGAASGSEISYQIGNTTGARMDTGTLNLSAPFADQWRLQQVQQFPFLGGFEQAPASAGFYEFEVEVIDHQPLGYGGATMDHLTSKSLEAEGGSVTIKLEENQQNFLSIPGNYDQYWSSSRNAWTDLSGSSTSSASHYLMGSTKHLFLRSDA